MCKLFNNKTDDLRPVIALLCPWRTIREEVPTFGGDGAQKSSITKFMRCLGARCPCYRIDEADKELCARAVGMLGYRTSTSQE